MIDFSGLATINREVSWLGFNHRVLQEAMSHDVPLIERLRFLGIFSNNQDEFFRVRVATLNRMMKLGKEAKSYFEMDPDQCLDIINTKVLILQEEFERTFGEIVKELKGHQIEFVDESGLDEVEKEQVRNHYNANVKPHIVPLMFTKKAPLPLIKDKSIYLAIKMSKTSISGEEANYALIEIPDSDVVSRFFVIEDRSVKGGKKIMLVDDIIRMKLHRIFRIFNFDKFQAFTVKLTRDSELDIAEDISISMMEKLSRSIEKRKKGEFVRFVYDQSIPEDLLDYLLKKFSFQKKQGLIPGGRYHNFKDFIGFPNLEKPELSFAPFTPVPHKQLEGKDSVLDELDKGDVLLHYPYHGFTYITDLLRESAIDPTVRSIRINVYRLAKNSRVVNALINAAKNGIKVVVVLELQARFDEKNNLYWSTKLEENGVKVQFGVTGLKVHAKLILIERVLKGKTRFYAHIGSGNFHEGNAKIYTDFSFLTADQNIAKEVAKVFKFLKDNYRREDYENILVAPYSLRSSIQDLIREQMEVAAAGGEALVRLKLNNLVDNELVQLIYQANDAGVKFQCVIRGICSIVPGVAGLSENIEIRSVVGRFLEHSRVFIFGAPGKEKVIISSADLMTRNLDNRVEVATPIYDEAIKQELIEVFGIYWKDNHKARKITSDLENPYIEHEGEPFSSQRYLREYYENKFND
mgnify:CR=1 FL=1